MDAAGPRLFLVRFSADVDHPEPRSCEESRSRSVLAGSVAAYMVVGGQVVYLRDEWKLIWLTILGAVMIE